MRDIGWLLIKKENDKNNHLVEFYSQLDPTKKLAHIAKFSDKVKQLKNTLSLIFKIENFGIT